MQQRCALFSAEVHIEQHDIRPFRAQSFVGLMHRRRLSHAETVQLEVHSDEHAQGSVVVDDQRRGVEDPHRAADRNDTIAEVTAGTGTGETYARAMGDLWTGLARPLARVDDAAAEPDQLADDDAIDAFRRLQYALHTARERAYGLHPPPGAETAHAELADALVCARDATAAVAEAVSLWGVEGVRPLLHEWRGALFRVRLARLRLVPPPPRRSLEVIPGPDGIVRPLIAFLLALAGALAFVAGATLALSPVWVGGMALVCASALVYRP